jgi:hypothetical protein
MESNMKPFAFILTLTLASGACFAQIRPSLAFSAGYSNIRLSTAADYLHFDRDGGYIDGEFGLNLGDRRAPLFLGFGASASYHYDTEDFHYHDYYGNYYTVYDTTSSVDFYSFEARIGVPITFSPSRRDPRGFFLFPKLGAGLLVSDYGIDTNFGTEYHTGAAFGVRPSIQAGYTWGWGAVGVEASYMWAWGDFGNLGDRAQEARVGAFLRFRF